MSFDEKNVTNMLKIINVILRHRSNYDKKKSEFLGVVVGVRQKIWTESESESKKSTPQGTNVHRTA